MTMSSTGVPVSFVYPLIKAIVLQGYNKDDFVRMAKLDDSILLDTEARLSGERFEEITRLAADLTNDPYFGLHQGQHMSASDLGILGYVMMHSKTLAKAMTAYEKYNVILCTGFNVRLDVRDRELFIRISYENPYITPSRHCIEDVTSSFYNLMVKLSCRPISLQGVWFTHPLTDDLSEYVRVFGIEPVFGAPYCGMLLDAEVLDYPVLFADPQMLDTFERIAEDTLNRLVQGKRLSDQLYGWLMRRMPQAFPSVREAAREFNMGVRTFQAKLQQENTSYKELVMHVRKELAIGLLAKAEYSIGEIAYLLHFSEPSAFQNAFKKWMNITPRQYRMEYMSMKTGEGI